MLMRLEQNREMGAEVFYFGQTDFACPKCGNKIEVEYEASEYPYGVPNYDDINATGARIIHGFQDLDFPFQEEIYSFDEQSKLYLPEEKKIITGISLSILGMIRELARNPQRLYQISPRNFEEIIAHVFSRNGFQVELTKQSRDGGRDIIAIKSDLGIPLKYIIEYKRYAYSNPVSVGLVRNLYGVQMQEGANKSVLATTSRFTTDAKEFAAATNTTQWGMALKDFNDICIWLNHTVQE
jgi:restriction system protein